MNTCLKYLWLFCAFLVFAASQGQQRSVEKVERQRVIVLTDITNEPDDQQSLVRFLVYANEYEVEGIIATTSVHLKSAVRPEKIHELINAYERVRPNLAKHSNGFPSAQHLRSVTKSHLPSYGLSGVGDDKSSDGSRLIIEAVDKNDTRPLWVSVWGGANCLAQALHEVKSTRTAEEVERFVRKLKVYTISDQDDAGRWIRNNFPGLFYVVTPSAEHWAEYYQATWTGISGDRFYKNGPMYKFEMVDNPWLEENIINNHGPLGELYPKLVYIMEGDTPSFLWLINNGLGSAISPAYGGWGGRYDFFQSYAEAGKIWTNTINSVDEVRLEDGRTYASDQATIWRWREAFQSDFAARMDWCTTDRAGANHNPVPVIDNDASKNVIHIKGDPGQKVKLSAAKSYDPDNNDLSFLWFVYKEAGHFTGDFVLTRNTGSQIEFDVPLLKKGETLHIICQVRDNGVPALYSYKRIVISNP